jgi:hypothetical protein
VNRLRARSLLSDDRKAANFSDGRKAANAAGAPIAAAKALSMLMPKEPENRFSSGMEEKPYATGREPLPGTPVIARYKQKHRAWRRFDL